MGIIMRNRVQFSGMTSGYTLEFEYPNISLYSDVALASQLDLASAVSTIVFTGISTESVSDLKSLTFAPPSSDLSNINSLRSDGIYNRPVMITRGAGSPIFSLPVGSFAFIKCSSHLQTLMGGVDNILPGDKFFVSNALANSGQGPYYGAMIDGKFVDVGTMSGSTQTNTGFKRFLGAGLYMALSSAEFGTKNSTVLVQKIDIVEETT